MIPEIGHFALILALFVALIQASLPLIGASRGDPTWMGLARPAATAQFLLIGIAFLALGWCEVTSDFSVRVIFENSRSDKPLLYKIAGIWGDHEGSMLLWVQILALYGVAVALFGTNLPLALKARVLSVQAMIATGFLLFILITSNPFARLDPAPLDGQGMNPLLQDPGLAFHPPNLYLGYVGFSIAFSFAIAALIEGKVDAAWARWVRPWTLAAWCFLTLGIALGSWWAYYTLGWGGWWYWDPVENASFMPWLAGTALLHSAVVAERRDTLKAWTILLAIIAFSFSLLGTFLVRSGIITSVHSFATDPARGIFVLILLGAATGGSLLLFAIRAPSLKGGGLFAPISREGGLLFNNVILSTCAGTVLLGTLFPLIVESLSNGKDKVSVGPPFFNSVFLPLMVPLVVAMAVGPMLPWKRADLGAALGRLKVALTIAVAVACATFVMEGGAVSQIWAAGGIGLAVWLFAGTVTEWLERVRPFSGSASDALHRAARLPRSAWGMTLAHAGMAVLIAGITGSTSWRSELVTSMKPGDSVEIAGHRVMLESIKDNVPGPNYTSLQATFVASRNGAPYATLHAERRTYPAPARDVTEAAIHTNLMGDLYAVIGDADGKGGYAVRLYDNPLVPWIFLGAGIMVAGGVTSLSDRRHRVGAPAKIRAAGPARTQPA
jgi:cytochrome c-type biogenesis protein CcmF